jgi:hypothetical protein
MLAAAQTIDDLKKYAWPSADWFDYSGMRAQAAEAHKTKAVQCGYMAPFFFHNLQVNTPVENIIAMYDEAWKYGRRG